MPIGVGITVGVGLGVTVGVMLGVAEDRVADGRGVTARCVLAMIVAMTAGEVLGISTPPHPVAATSTRLNQAAASRYR